MSVADDFESVLIGPDRFENYAKSGVFVQNRGVLDTRGTPKSLFLTPFLEGPGVCWNTCMGIMRVLRISVFRGCQKRGPKMTPFWGTPRDADIPGVMKTSIFYRFISVRNGFDRFCNF